MNTNRVFLAEVLRLTEVTETADIYGGTNIKEKYRHSRYTAVYDLSHGYFYDLFTQNILKSYQEITNKKRTKEYINIDSLVSYNEIFDYEYYNLSQKQIKQKILKYNKIKNK